MKLKPKNSNSKIEVDEVALTPPTYNNSSTNATNNASGSWHQYVSVAPSQPTNISISAYQLNLAGSSAEASLDGYTATPGSGSLADDKPTQYGDFLPNTNGHHAIGMAKFGAVEHKGEADTAGQFAADAIQARIAAEMLPGRQLDTV